MKQDGMNLIGMIMTIGVILILFMSIYVAVDPASRINTAKDKTRDQDVMLLAQAMKEYMLDNKGDIPITGDITTSKKVLCNSAISLTCAGDTEDCLIIDTTTDFLDNYLATLPVDPDKTNTADTGYYIQNVNGQVILGSCNYEDEAITYNPRIVDTPEAAAPACGGTEFEDYCWYLSDNLLDDCDDVCAGNGLTCVSGVTYASKGDCSLHAAMGIGCSDGCDVSSQVYSPSILNPAYGFEYCYTDTANPVYYCGGYNYADFLILCACEAA